MARRRSPVTRPHDALRRAVDAHRALVDPAVATEQAATAELEAAAEAERGARRRSQTRDKGGRYK